MAMNKVDHRRMERFPLRLPARLVPVDSPEDNHAIEIQTSDVCSGGAFFQTDRPLPLGTEIKVEMILPLDELKKLKGKRAHIQVTGAVVRTTKEGMAVCFNDVFKITPLRK